MRFLTTHGEQLRREEHLRKVAERQSSAEERIRGLELQLEAAQKQRDEEVGEAAKLITGAFPWQY